MRPPPRTSNGAGDDICELAQFADPASLAHYLNERPELLRADIVRQLAEAVRHEVRVNLERALRWAEAALAIAHRINEPESLGLGSRAKANALWFGGKLRDAIELFEAAVRYFEASGLTGEVGRTLSSCIQPLLLLGEYERALESAVKARGIFRTAGDLKRLARLEINVANVYQRQARFSQALGCYQRAYEELQPYKDEEALAAALHNMAVCHIILNDFDRALDTYRSARKVSGENDMPLVVAQADYNIAYLHFLRGDYQRALQGLCAARELFEKNGNEYHSALCDLDQSEIYLELNLSQEAARMARRAQKQFEHLGTPLEAGRSLFNFAIALDQQQEPAKALDLFQKAQDIFAREQNVAWRALVELYRALVLWETGHAEAAAEPCNAALDFFTASGLNRRAILCRLLLARVSKTNGQLPEAQEHCEAALEALATIQAPLLSYQAHLIKGDLHRACGDPRQSYRSYQKARRNLEALRGSLQGEEIKIAFMKNKVDVYEKLVDIFLQRNTRGARERAFQYMERAKSRILVELAFGRSNLPAWRGAAVGGERLNELRQELNWYYRRLEIEQTRPDGISVEQIQDLQTRARSLEDEVMQTIRQMPAATNAGQGLRPLRPAAIREVRATLGDDATLLEYFQSGSRLIAAVLTRADLEIVDLGETCPIASSIRMLEFQLSKSTKTFGRAQFTPTLQAATECRLHELYRVLIAPLIGKFRGRHLVVVPHGVLHYLPFHALWDGSRYLIERFTISYAPSGSIHALCERKPANCTGPSLLMGVPDKRVPWVRREIRAIAEVLPQPEVRLGESASFHTLKTAGPSSRFVHLATHGVFRRDNPMFSSVRLADSYLNLYDLYQLTLPVELLTLSGCATGLGVVAAGDELLGLARGLLSAGAQSLLLTLWDVHDQTTARFMVNFYSRLQQHGDKPAALREAMLEIRKTHPHPYYWAPFVLVGKSFPPAG